MWNDSDFFPNKELFAVEWAYYFESDSRGEVFPYELFSCMRAEVHYAHENQGADTSQDAGEWKKWNQVLGRSCSAATISS